MPAGLTANVNAAMINQQIGAALANAVKSLASIDDFNSVYLNFAGSSGLEALGMTAADAAATTNAVYEAVKLYEVMRGTAIIAAGGQVTENAVGHNFLASFQPLLGTGIN